MLAIQYGVWMRYPEYFRDRCSFVVVDDGSPRWPAADVPRPEGLKNLSIYRVLEDIPWHQDGARNLGAHVAPDGWLFLSDMDHVLPPASLEGLWRQASDPGKFYTFDRNDAATGEPMRNAAGEHKPHPNTYAMTRSMYWLAGGYDEDFCGVYGTDGAFRKQLVRVGLHHHLRVPIVRYSRDVVPDASTTTLDRKAYGGVDAKRAAHARKAEAGRTGRILTLAFKWERAL
jgi:hypothetical protein